MGLAGTVHTERRRRKGLEAGRSNCLATPFALAVLTVADTLESGVWPGTASCLDGDHVAEHVVLAQGAVGLAIGLDDRLDHVVDGV